MHSAVLVAEGFSDIGKVLLPEIREKIPRSEASLRTEGDALVIEIKAGDTVALRASLSSYLRWLSAALSAKKAMEE